MNASPITIDLMSSQTVSGLLQVPEKANACYVLAHGAGAGMSHPFMAAVADGLSDRGVATLRYQFPFMEHGSRRPDRPEVARAAVMGAVATAVRLMPSLPLFAGGKSFGARMTTQAQAAVALENVLGLGFLGFPLHAAKKPSDDRARHLSEVRIPMLFLQGTRDALAELRLLVPVIERLGENATLCLIEDADHSFHVPVRSGKTDTQVLGEVLDILARWIIEVAARGSG